MPVSFADSLKAAERMAKYSQAHTFAVAAAEEETWTLDDIKYAFYEDYSDNSMSTVSVLKDVTLAADQINLTQETNSQLIPFEMPRYYDGFDLTNASIRIYYVNKNKQDHYSNPINVYYSDSKIKFGWLIDKYVTAVEGIVQFEIQAVGVNSKGDDYIWKTRPCDGINILRSLSGTTNIDPSANWITTLTTQITNMVNAKLAEVIVDKEDIGEVVDEALQDYYTADEVDNALESIPAKLSDDGFATISGIRKATAIDAVMNDNEIVLTFTMQGGVKLTKSVALDANGFPSSITSDGVTCNLTWTGFENATAVNVSEVGA